MLTSNPMSTTSAGSPLAAARAPERDALEISGTAVRIARLSDEWYQDLDDPESYIQELKRNRVRADLFDVLAAPAGYRTALSLPS